MLGPTNLLTKGKGGTSKGGSGMGLGPTDMLMVRAIPAARPPILFLLMFLRSKVPPARRCARDKVFLTPVCFWSPQSGGKKKAPGFDLGAALSFSDDEDRPISARRPASGKKQGGGGLDPKGKGKKKPDPPRKGSAKPSKGSDGGRGHPTSQAGARYSNPLASGVNKMLEEEGDLSISDLGSDLEIDADGGARHGGSRGGAARHDQPGSDSDSFEMEVRAVCLAKPRLRACGFVLGRTHARWEMGFGHVRFSQGHAPRASCPQISLQRMPTPPCFLPFQIAGTGSAASKSETDQGGCASQGGGTSPRHPRQQGGASQATADGIGCRTRGKPPHRPWVNPGPAL